MEFVIKKPFKGDYPITQVFGNTDVPDGVSYKMHTGIDYGLFNVPILSAQKGKVIYAAYDGDWGYKVDIDHGNGFMTRYAHLKEIYVRKGDEVPTGYKIGLSGNTGNSKGPHLHFGLYKDGVAVNPQDYIVDYSVNTDDKSDSIKLPEPEQRDPIGLAFVSEYGVRIRQRPSVDGQFDGLYLTQGLTVGYYAKITDSQGNEWLELSTDMYACCTYQGDVYITLL